MPASDITARARIRDTAIEQIARKGYGVSMRVIAEAAGVSLGLINHHFGSKVGLRTACDDHVLETIRNVKSETVRGGAAATLAALGRMSEYANLTAYCLRAISTGGEVARRFVDHFVADSRTWMAQGVADGTLRPSVDEEARIRMMTLQGFGGMQLYLAQRMGEADVELAPDQINALLEDYLGEYGLVTLELYSFGLFATSDIFDAFLQAGPNPGAATTEEH
ncbi:TetR/AcrR family transcriptional regulator [Zhihengliuella halotolerans]|uniref:TetR family transcriptional regulator n=1 Tax=Zhihengliuella halotolerans TaxID=370736 RepID=A0A4Q8AIF9_9MICC|nr:TetR family transcriptional regulator [Zhihengliuella halotolerans]RZU63555.1 TetR family transcriptional regulator [Zhihengliuella halotolerans]